MYVWNVAHAFIYHLMGGLARNNPLDPPAWAPPCFSVLQEMSCHLKCPSNRPASSRKPMRERSFLVRNLHHHRGVETQVTKRAERGWKRTQRQHAMHRMTHRAPPVQVLLRFLQSSGNNFVAKSYRTQKQTRTLYIVPLPSRPMAYRQSDLCALGLGYEDFAHRAILYLPITCDHFLSRCKNDVALRVQAHQVANDDAAVHD